jgi:hypothetical protein
LIWHSDAEGWYLPDDFQMPIMQNDLSIGSSVRLLAELEELCPDRSVIPDDFDWDLAWDAVYLAAVASVVTGTPIEFH